MALTLHVPDPPANEMPLGERGQHSPAWREYFQRLSRIVRGIRTGAVDGSDAVAGDIGEYLEAVTTGAVTLTTAVTADILTLDLTAGDWDVWGWIAFEPGGGTTVVVFGWGLDGIDTGAPGGSGIPTLAGWTGPRRYNATAVATTVTLRALVDFSGGAMTVIGGRLMARRAR